MSRAIPLFILHWNRPVECVTSVAQLRVQGVPVDITVVDNNSSSAALEQLREELPEDVGVIGLDRNLGWGAAFNVVLKKWVEAGVDEFCIVAAHDAAPEPNALRHLVDCALTDSRLGIVCPEYGTEERPVYSPLHCVGNLPCAPLPPGTLQLVQIPFGTLLLFRRSCLEQIGLFDERYFAYGDEHELGLRANRFGWKVGMVWGAVVKNPGTWTPSTLRSYLFARNSLLMVRTYSGLAWAITRMTLLIINGLRMVISPPSAGYAFSFQARCLAVRDFLLQRFGPPPSFS